MSESMCENLQKRHIVSFNKEIDEPFIGDECQKNDKNLTINLFHWRIFLFFALVFAK